MNKKKLKLSIILVICGIGIGGVITYLFLNNVFSIPCVFHELTGYYCPGCGVTRMLISLLRLEFNQAFHYNCFLFVLFPIAFLYLGIYWIYWVRDKVMYKLPNIIWIILLIVTILFGILRNTDLFYFLAPTVLT